MSTVPHIPATELASLTRYSNSNPSNHSDAPRGPGDKPCLLCEYVHCEVKGRTAESDHRIVALNDHWVALVPWWATWPFETMCECAPANHSVHQFLNLCPVLPYKRHIPSLLDLTHEEKAAFADALSRLTKRYDNLFQCSFSYSMGIHQRPTPRKNGVTEDGDDVAHLHLHFTPPLLRSSTVRKFLVG